MKTKRTTVTISADIYELAQRVMKVRRFKDFSGFLQQLIREDWERRHGPMAFTEAGPEYVTQPQTISKRKRSHRDDHNVEKR